jgi:Na+/H+ antiporter NhaC
MHSAITAFWSKEKRCRATVLQSTALIVLALTTGAMGADAAPAPRFRIEAPAVRLGGVPVDRVQVTALTPAGDVDFNFTGPADVNGLRWSIDGEEQELPPFESGRLTLTTNRAAGQLLFVEGDRITVREPGEDDAPPAVHEVHAVPGWVSLVPPVLAVGLAVCLRNVLVSLSLGLLAGAVVLSGFSLWDGFLLTLREFVVGVLADPADGHSHVQVILFTLFLGAMVGVMSRGGGTAALVHSLAGLTRTRERGQMLTSGLGFAVFFDDYANILLLGGTMRPVTDRLRISREKLSFLIDSTAAPVSGLMIISTWIGVELGYIRETFAELGLERDAYATFLATIPYRFYPILILGFVLMIAASGRDFGPMRRAERRAFREGILGATSAETEPTPDEAADGERVSRRKLAVALVPLAVLLGGVAVGLWWTGRGGQLAEAEPDLSLQGILSAADSYGVLLVSSFLASAAGFIVAVGTRLRSLGEATADWEAGLMSMVPAILILTLAWGLATVCNSAHLNTAGYLVELSAGRVAPAWLPTLAFLLAAAISFATGTSWGTIGILMPLVIAVTYSLLTATGATRVAADPVMLGAIGSVLAGSIFGDHCSPISDTTVLSSAASGCDHLAHVSTQMPYALAAAAASVLLGTIPAGFGVSPWILLPLGLAALWLLLWSLGRRVDVD